MRVSFTGGTASPSGALPAYFMTKDPIVQFIIENSKEFKDGFIRIEMQHAVAGEHPRMAVPNQKQTKAETKAEPAQPKPAETKAETPAEAAMPQGESETRVVTVADKADAIEWLKENYADKGYTATKLRTQTAFEEACKECNVQFQFTA